MNPTKKQTYLSFKLEDEIFAIRVEKVLEVLEIQKITRVPKAPEYIKGLVNFRGEILPVVDTRVKFNLPISEETDRTVIIVLDLKNKDKSVILGALADSVQDVIEIDFTEIKSVPELGSRYSNDYISGMWKSGDNFIMLLDIEKVFAIEDIVIKEQVDIDNDYLHF